MIEELARVDGSIGLIVAAHNSLCTNHIYKFGNEEQRKKYVVPLAQGKKLGCWSLTEPRSRLRCGRHADRRRAQGRRLDSQRLENIYRPTATTRTSAWPWP